MIIGIDPGLNGAIAFLSPVNSLVIEDMPTIQHNNKKEINGLKLYQSLMEVKGYTPIVVIEDVNSMPHDGVVSAFRFGQGFGEILAAVKITKYKLLRIKPGAWKSALALTQNKNDSILKARRIFPRHAKKYFNHKKHHDRAEAALLAYYVRECFREGAG